MTEQSYILEEARFKAMVDAFLSWKVPEDFSPDAGISFDRKYDYNSIHWPVGTNLLTSEQAYKMFKDCAPPKCFGNPACSIMVLPFCQWVYKCGKK